MSFFYNNSQKDVKTAKGFLNLLDKLNVQVANLILKNGEFWIPTYAIISFINIFLKF